MPSRIFPASGGITPPGGVASGSSMISIMFDSALNWPFVVGSTASQTQIFTYIPTITAMSLGISM